MKLSGMISKIMDNYVCLRGIAGIKELANISEVNPDIQRDLLAEHGQEMREFLEKGEYTFFPEVVLSTYLGLENEDAAFNDFAIAVDSVDSGFNSKVGKIKINFKADSNKLIDGRRQLKAAQLEFDENEVRLSRIDGNHRLSAAAYLANDVMIPFCLIVFPSENEAENNSRAIFHNINSKQIPLELEQNTKIIIESSAVYTDAILEKNQPFGLHYKFARELLCGDGGIDFGYFPFIKDFVYESRYSFFTDLFKHLLQEQLLNKATAVYNIKRQLVNIESALKESNIVAQSANSAIVGALAYYKFSHDDKFNRFVKWITKNHIADVATVKMSDIICIFDKVYDNIPKKVFLARWYPAVDDSNCRKAQQRLSAIKNAVESLNLELVDMGTREGGTFDIRSVMYGEIGRCDIFIADLTGCRHNVMVEVGYALGNYDKNRMLFYFTPTNGYSAPPFDLNGFRYEQIDDSAEIETKVKPLIESILLGMC